MMPTQSARHLVGWYELYRVGLRGTDPHLFTHVSKFAF